VKGKDQSGKVLQYEPGGEFYHVAISFKGYWLQSLPPNGVGLVDTATLQKLGEVTIVPLFGAKPLDEREVAKYMGRPFDFDFGWGDSKIYCAELIAKLLHIEPTPMDFSSSVWPKHYRKKQGQLGISPDDIYKALKYKALKPTCKKLLTN
jgi:hypothetical protein